ncbi:MAG: class B sortase [Clostridia bacterium]|nr:class B sortase [Clostridia bacterium]
MNSQLINDKLKAFSEKTVRLLIEKGITISTAESCTGGLLSQAITSVSGASAIFEIGLAAYTNRIKHEALSVPVSVLQNDGAVSLKTAMYMAKNIVALSSSQLGVSITGNAGPSASEGKPVGLVYISIANEETFFVKKIQLPSQADRDTVRLSAVFNALELIYEYATSSPALLGRMVPYGEEFILYDEENKYDLGFFEQKEKSFKRLSINTLTEKDFLSEEEEEEEETKPIIKITPVFLKIKEFFTVVIEKIKALNLKERFTLKKKIDKKKLVTFLIFAVAIAGLLTSSFAITSHFVNESRQRAIVKEARKQWSFSEEKEDKSGELLSFDSLQAQNNDIKAWISIDNTNINNPVYQTTDNSFYIDHNMQKEKSRYGALFFDHNNIITNSKASQNLTIYGHNMKDGSMFGTLQKYRKLDFYKSNPTFKLTTLYGQYEYRIFSVMVMNATSKDDNNYIYNFVASDFENQGVFESWIYEAQERSLITTTVDVKKNDDILTLVTCSEDFNNSRFVVMARKTRVNETEPVDVSGAKLNPNPRYPQAWYDKKGLKGYNVE